MLIFKAEIRIQAPAPKDENDKKIFMQNAENVIQQGLAAMTVPDWIVSVIDIEEEDE